MLDGDFALAPTQALFFFKCVAAVGDKLISLLDGRTEFQTGVTISMHDTPTLGDAESTLGFLVHRTVEQAMTFCFPQAGPTAASQHRRKRRPNELPSLQTAASHALASDQLLAHAPRRLLVVLAWTRRSECDEFLGFESIRPVAVELPPLDHSSHYAVPVQADSELSSAKSAVPNPLDHHQLTIEAVRVQQRRQRRQRQLHLLQLSKTALERTKARWLLTDECVAGPRSAG